METIILTDNMRLSTDYYADKTIFAQKIDVNHILNTEVYQSHISQVRFWTIRTNIYNEETFVHEICKNLLNRGTSTLRFQFSINKITINQQFSYNQQKRNTVYNQKYHSASRVSAYCMLDPAKTLSFPHLTNAIKNNSNIKTASSVKWSNNNESLFEEQRKAYDKQVISTPKKNLTSTKNNNQVIRLKQMLKKQFQISSLSELSTVLMTNKQDIFSEYGMKEQVIMKSDRMITSYIFRQKDIEIGLSVVSQGCKKYIQKVINMQISQDLNVHFNTRKQAYQSTCLTQNFSYHNIVNSSTKSAHEIPKQTYHKILLFLFTRHDIQIEKSKVSSSKLIQSNVNKQMSKYIMAIQQWKIKNQDINLTEKLSKEYVLIKQEVQNQKLSFKNKLKIFEAIIGQSVNVQKLLNEEKQIENNAPNINTTNKTSESQQQNNQKAPTTITQNCRINSKSQLKSILGSPILMAASSNSQFKRLKQSFEMIRNIDNIINEQNKKIQTLKSYQKEIQKSKNQMLSINAKTLNQVKKQIHQIKEQIQQKKLQSKFKLHKLEQDKNSKKQNFLPTPATQQLLESKVKIFRQIFLNERSNKNNQKYLIDEDFIDKKQIAPKQNLQRLSYNSKLQPELKKSFLIRKQISSLSQHKLNQSMQQMLQTCFHKQISKPSGYPPAILSTLYQCQQQKQTRLMKKRREQVENNNIWHNIQQQQNSKFQNEEKSQEMSNHKEKEVLLMLYDYYLSNCQLIKETNNQLESYHMLNNPKIVTVPTKNCFNNSQVFINQSRTIQKTVDENQGLFSTSASQNNFQKKLQKQTNNFSVIKKATRDDLFLISPCLNLQTFPVLSAILHPKISDSGIQSEQCSIIQDTISENKIQNRQKEGQKQQKRVTLQNIVPKK